MKLIRKKTFDIVKIQRINRYIEEGRVSLFKKNRKKQPVKDCNDMQLMYGEGLSLFGGDRSGGS